MTDVSVALDVWLCPKKNPTNISFVPEEYNSSRLLPKSQTPVRALALHIFRPDNKICSSTASLYKIIRHEVLYSVNFFGARREHHTETHLAVSAEECKLMIRHKGCVHGEVKESAGIWRTAQELTLRSHRPPSAAVYSISRFNCYFYKTSVQARHNADSPQSSVGNMSS